jgi:tRNA U38,U39,U40 pseudouridine synthase TruA
VIVETFEPSLVLLNYIHVEINPTSNLEMLETLSNKAKKVTISVRGNEKLMKEYHANFQSVTKHLTIYSYSEIPMVNIF